jgi:peptidoglycan/LPS O-acetylase OafA/YrhL
MRYVRSLDGIRAVAVVFVILFHCGFFHPGWIGVQIFFTLSGFLITRILLADRTSPFSAYLARFYWRRALRIFPLYLFFLLAAAVCWWMSGVPASFGTDWPYLFTYTANFARIRDADLGPVFVHVWSLAVEEQFYLLWPLLLYLLPLKAFKASVAAILFLAPALRLALFVGLRHAGHDSDYAGKLAYVLPFTQFDAFAIGASIPLWGLDRIKRAGSLFLAALGLAGVAGLANVLAGHLLRGGVDKWAFGYPMYLVDAYGYVWGYSLLNLVSALGIVCTLQKLRPATLLENPFLVRIGKVSYGVYIYHLPLLVVGHWCLARLGFRWNPLSTGVFFVVYLAAVLAVAEASFRWLESPFLRLKDVWASQPEAAQREMQPQAPAE